MLEEARREDLAKIITMLVQMDETGITIMTSNASVLLARQEAEKKLQNIYSSSPVSPKATNIREENKKESE